MHSEQKATEGTQEKRTLRSLHLWSFLSRDLVNWETMATVPIPAGGQTLIDPAAATEPFLFYRAVSVPGGGMKPRRGVAPDQQQFSLWTR